MKMIVMDMKRYHGIMFERFVEVMIREGIIELSVSSVSGRRHQENKIDLTEI